MAVVTLDLVHFDVLGCRTAPQCAAAMPWAFPRAWPACGMLWGWDVPASARACQVLGVRTGCRHPALPRERCPGGVSPARGGDSSATGAVAVPMGDLLSLLSQPLCFGRQSMCANGTLTSESVLMCHQQCWGRKQGFFLPPLL